MRAKSAFLPLPINIYVGSKVKIVQKQPFLRDCLSCKGSISIGHSIQNMNHIQAKTVLLHCNYYELITSKKNSDIYLFCGHYNQFNDGWENICHPKTLTFGKKWPQIIFCLKNDKSFTVLSSKTQNYTHFYLRNDI